MALNWTEIIEKIMLPAGGYLVRVVQTGLGRSRMRRQLYREISRNYHKLDLQICVSTSLTGLSQAAPLRFAENMDISFDVWNFYNDEKRRASLFELKEADAISRIYDHLNRIGMDLSGSACVRAKEALAEIDDRLLDRSLSKKLFEKVSSPETQPFVADLFSGKRKSYRRFLNPL